MKRWMLVWVIGLGCGLGAQGQVGFPASFVPKPEALEALVSDGSVRVEVVLNSVAVFDPVGVRASKGLILYPGGFVDFRSYAPLARAVAAKGYRVVVVKPPLDLAILGTWWVNPIVRFYGDIERWAVGGHSLGGVAAAQVAGGGGRPQKLRGVVLLGSYPSRQGNLAGSGLSVISIFGSEDGLTTPADVARSLSLLPRSVVLVPVAGANHTQFGSYWDGAGEPEAFVQPGDNPALILPETQTQAIADVIGVFMMSL